MAELKKCIIIPDSFKGTLSAIQVCDCMKKGVQKVFPDCEILTIPVADGGEGTVDCFLQAEKAVRVPVEATGPFGEPVNAYYARMGNTAVLEMAQVAGLPQAEGHLDPVHATTAGLGMLMRQAIADGCKDLVIGLGGSCTNDGGVGAAKSMGVRFLNHAGEEFLPPSDRFSEIARIDSSACRELLHGVTVTAMCDVTNPLTGKNGASHIYGPQKGADEETIFRLDESLQALASRIQADLGMDVLSLPGGGAAGGLGAGVAAFFGGKLRSGIETVLDMTGFDSALAKAQLVLTGEGRIDGQSLQGKVLSGVAERAKQQGVPVVAIGGSVRNDAESAYAKGIVGLFSINRMAEDFSVSRHHTRENLEAVTEAVIRLWKAAGR